MKIQVSWDVMPCHWGYSSTFWTVKAPLSWGSSRLRWNTATSTHQGLCMYRYECSGTQN